MAAFETMTKENLEALFSAQFDLDMDRLTALLTAEGLTLADWDAWCAEEDETETDEGWVWEDPWDE